MPESAGAHVQTRGMSSITILGLYMYMCRECKKVRKGSKYGIIDKCNECEQKQATKAEEKLKQTACFCRVCRQMR